MIALSEIGPRAVQVLVEGEITANEVTRALGEIDAIRARWPKFDCLADVRGHITFGLSALAAEFTKLGTVFGLLSSLDRVALVADEDWIRLAGKIEGKLLFMLDYRTFERPQLDAARRWVLREE